MDTQIHVFWHGVRPLRKHSAILEGGSSTGEYQRVRVELNLGAELHKAAFVCQGEQVHVAPRITRTHGAVQETTSPVQSPRTRKAAPVA